MTAVSSVAVAVGQTRPRYQEIARSNNQCLDAECDNLDLVPECSEQFRTPQHHTPTSVLEHLPVWNEVKLIVT